MKKDTQTRTIFAIGRVMTLSVGLLFAMGCTKDRLVGRSSDGTPLEIVGLNTGSASLTRAAEDGSGSTGFTDGDAMGLFLRGEGYASVDNRRAYCAENGGRWVIDGDAILLNQRPATVSALFPYAEATALDNVPLMPGSYDVNGNDVVWAQRPVSATDPQIRVLDMQHVMARIKLKIKGGDLGEGTVTSVSLDNGPAVTAGSVAVIYSTGRLDMTSDIPVAGVTMGPVTDHMVFALSDQEQVVDMLVLPVAALAENLVSLKVTVDGETLVQSVPFAAPAAQWEAGVCYVYTVTVKNKQVIFDKVVATEWNDGGTTGRDGMESVNVGALVSGGLVYWVDPDDATHYKIVSLDEGAASNWSTAAVWVKSYGPGWELPSEAELTQIYNARRDNGGAGTSLLDKALVANNGGAAFGSGAYWSSEQIDADHATAVNLSDGFAASQAKTQELAVRAVRSFPAEFFLDYTDNGQGWFVLAPADALNPTDGTATMNWFLASGYSESTYNPGQKKACPDGWSAGPDVVRPILLWVYKNAIPNNQLVAGKYWNAMASGLTAADKGGYTDFGTGETYAMVMPTLNSVRCMRVNDAGSGNKYPYVMNNAAGKAVIIVSRDFKGGVNPGAFHGKWTATPQHNEQSADNAVAAKFEVAAEKDALDPLNLSSTMNWYVAMGIYDASYNPTTVGPVCVAPWRLPTQRELQLMNALLPQLTGVHDFTGTYFAGTDVSAATSKAWYVSVNNGGIPVSMTFSKGNATYMKIRCVRDVD